MARLTKKELKNILKECLVEILREDNVLSSLKENINKSKNNINQNNITKRKLTLEEKNRLKNQLTDDSEDNSRSNIKNINNSVLVENIAALSEAVGSINGKKDLFADILADTAATTYQKQAEYGVRGTVLLEENYSNDEMEKEISTLQDIAGGDLNHWAKVAFNKKD